MDKPKLVAMLGIDEAGEIVRVPIATCDENDPDAGKPLSEVMNGRKPAPKSLDVEFKGIEISAATLRTYDGGITYASSTPPSTIGPTTPVEIVR